MEINACRLGSLEDTSTLAECSHTISEVTWRVCADELGKQLCAVVLTGSLARGEATIVNESTGWRVLGDAEYLLIFHQGAPLPTIPAINSLRYQIEGELKGAGLVCPIGLSAVRPNYLRKMRPHIFGCELRAFGQVVWGDRQILSLIPPFSPMDIPVEDGWRLLCNRIVELLEVAHCQVAQNEFFARDLWYRAMKLYLDMATSFLVFERMYAPSYRARAERLRILGETTAARDGFVSFSVRDFAEKVSFYTELKLQWGSKFTSLQCFNDTVESTHLWEEIVQYAAPLWRWELAQMVGTCSPTPDHTLLGRWMAVQPLRKKLRGWAYVVRKLGWHESWREWPRWIGAARRASPRYAVYAIASQLLFRIPFVSADAPKGQDYRSENLYSRVRTRGDLVNVGCHELVDEGVQEIRGWLPVLRVREANGKRLTWQQLVSEVTWNYHEFVEATRA